MIANAVADALAPFAAEFNTSPMHRSAREGTLDGVEAAGSRGRSLLLLFRGNYQPQIGRIGEMASGGRGTRGAYGSNVTLADRYSGRLDRFKSLTANKSNNFKRLLLFLVIPAKEGI